MALVREMPVKAVSALLGGHGTRIWWILVHNVQDARDRTACGDNDGCLEIASIGVLHVQYL